MFAEPAIYSGEWPRDGFPSDTQPDHRASIKARARQNDHAHALSKAQFSLFIV